MADEGLDAVSRSLARGLSRRQAIKGLVAAIIALITGVSGQRKASAQQIPGPTQSDAARIRVCQQDALLNYRNAIVQCGILLLPPTALSPLRFITCVNQASITYFQAKQSCSPCPFGFACYETYGICCHLAAEACDGPVCWPLDRNAAAGGAFPWASTR